MMKTLFQCYNELLCDSSKWKYYTKAAVNPCRFDEFIAPKNHTLEKMLSVGGKSTLVINNAIRSLSGERYSHILSTYIMGLCIYEKSAYVRDCLDSFIGELELNKDAKYRKFMYIWLLMCYFHDIGYAIEDGRYDVDLCSYDNPPDNEGNVSIDAKLPDGFTNDLFDRYKVYREKCMRMKDHGIWGGRIFYKEVESVRNQRFQQVRSCKKNKDCKCDGLYCREELRLIYSKVAQTIMAHNIYYADENTIDCYRCMHLDELITRKKYNINIKDHPLLFFFDLVDSMEPIKRPELASALGKIRWHIYDKSIVFDLGKMTCPQRKLYTRQLTGMNSWLTSVRTDQEQCNIIRVKIKY